jgi:hypothetical protein
MMDLIGSLVSGVLSGGATGLLGLLLKHWFDFKTRQQDLELVRLNHANALEVRKLELDAQQRIAERGAQAQERVAEVEAAAREAEAAERSYQASHESDRATFLAPEAQRTSRLARWLMAAVDAFRGIIRPGVTIYVLVLLTMLLVWVQHLFERAQLQLTPEQTKDLALQVIGTVTYLCTTVTVWWFGVRGQPAPRR